MRNSETRFERLVTPHRRDSKFGFIKNRAAVLAISFNKGGKADEDFGTTAKESPATIPRNTPHSD